MMEEYKTDIRKREILSDGEVLRQVAQHHVNVQNERNSSIDIKPSEFKRAYENIYGRNF